MRHFVTKIVQTVLFAGIALFTFCTSALADMDWKRMKRDLAIQESILDQFFDTTKGSTTGLYIENHGVLLIASGWMQKYGEISRLHVHAIGDKSENLEIAIPGKRVLRIQKSKDDKSSENEEEILEFAMFEKKPNTSHSQSEVIKKQIAEFLSIYGNAIGQLKDDDRVTILLQWAEPYVFSFSTSNRDRQMEALEALNEAHEASKKQPEFLRRLMENLKKKQEASKNMAFKITYPKGILLEAIVTKRDIDAYNRGKIDGQTFHDRIIFREHKPPRPVRDKTIDIMAGILTNTLKKNRDLHFLSGTQCIGFYQKGIGALFLVSQKPSLLHFEPKNTDAFKAAVIATLADYGPTLRGLLPEESIIVHTNLTGQSHFKIADKDKTADIKPPDRILFRVAKRDIDASQKIDLDTFKKRVTITEM